MRLLDNKNVDAGLISSPAYSHVEFPEAAVAAGKHVYCEKPGATDVDGCRRVTAAGEKLKWKAKLGDRFPAAVGVPDNRIQRSLKCINQSKSLISFS